MTDNAMTDEDAIRNMLTAYVAAWHRNDMDAWGALFTRTATSSPTPPSGGKAGTRTSPVTSRSQPG